VILTILHFTLAAKSKCFTTLPISSDSYLPIYNMQGKLIFNRMCQLPVPCGHCSQTFLPESVLLSCLPCSAPRYNSCLSRGHGDLGIQGWNQNSKTPNPRGQVAHLVKVFHLRKLFQPWRTTFVPVKTGGLQKKIGIRLQEIQPRAEPYRTLSSSRDTYK